MQFFFLSFSNAVNLRLKSLTFGQFLLRNSRTQQTNKQPSQPEIRKVLLKNHLSFVLIDLGNLTNNKNYEN